MPKLGVKLTEEARKKISLSKLGKKRPLWVRELLRSSRKGKKHSEITKKKMSLAHMGNRSNTGKKLSINHRRNISEGMKKVREKLWSWKGGLTQKHLQIRKSFEAKLWRESVFRRDNFTCRFCGVKGGKLEADHIKPFALYPELRFAIDNGRTLCKQCHMKTETYLNKWYKPIL